MSCSQDCGKFAKAVFAAFAAFNIMEYLFHGVALTQIYQRPYYQRLWNPIADMTHRRWAGLLAYLVLSALFTKIYVQGYEEDRPWTSQGLRYGLMMGTLISSYHALLSYMIYPVSPQLTFAWIVGGIGEIAALGMIVAAIYRPSHDHSAAA